MLTQSRRFTVTAKRAFAMISAHARPMANLLRGRPVLATFQVTLRCNSACGYCDLPLNQGRYELTREEIRGIFGQLYTEGIRFVLVQGGEPLLRTDLVDILSDLSLLGLQVTVITNGTRLTTDLVARFASLRLPLSVSLDTLDRARYRQIRGADQLPQVLAGLSLLVQYPYPKFLTCIVSEVNREEVPDVVRFAKARGFIPVVGAYHWNVGLYGKEDTGLMYGRSAAAGLFELLLKEDLIPPGYFRHFVKDSAVWLRGERLEPCDAGRYSIAIDASGQVSACLAMPGVGNLREVPYREILGRFDRTQIQVCSDCSSCNRLDGRVVGTILRHPVTAWRTPVRFQ
ncbi:MAG: radical SAM protein [Nitrospira sp.]|nr:radical SAM protein [Nitrospira sp.]